MSTEPAACSRSCLLPAACPALLLAAGDPFEQLVNAYLDNRSRRLAARLGLGMRSGISRFTAFVKKHRRTDSHQQLPLFSGGSSAGQGGGGGGSFRGSFPGLAESPEVQRLKQLAATFASVAVGAGQMRRNLTEGSNLGEWSGRCCCAACCACCELAERLFLPAGSSSLVSEGAETR